jgi:hypothetical protein
MFWHKRDKKVRKVAQILRAFPRLESLEDRTTPAVTASFNPVTGALSVLGDDGNNAILLSIENPATPTAASRIVVLVDGVTSVPITGGTPTLGTTASVSVDLRGNPLLDVLTDQIPSLTIG